MFTDVTANSSDILALSLDLFEMFVFVLFSATVAYDYFIVTTFIDCFKGTLCFYL